ncbi:hypothetical protein E2C01_076449 [Portunus trituberculatus]|uniref:Uncharacterized protein n=1 Tax=Portunus trituberculatus TaxID=210409 RepID=A0A5B7INK0_PORTR|nr:hypothetical protein [Portunus trituberculatus]
MGNSVGFYAVADQLQAGRIGSTVLANFGLPIAETGLESRNVERLSVTTICAEDDVPSLVQVTHSDCASMEAATSIQSLISVESGRSCSEVQMGQEVQECEEVGGDASDRILTQRSSDVRDNIQVCVGPQRMDTESEETVDVKRLTARLIYEESYDNNENERREDLDPCRDNESSATSLAAVQPSSFIESLLQELEGSEASTSNENIGLLDEEEFFDDRPVVYTATNPADWRLGIIEEEGVPEYWKTKSNFVVSSTSDLEAYESSEEEDGLTIDSVVNVNNIDAEREKEEGIQLCLEPFENKIGKIEACLLNSTETLGNSEQRMEEIRPGAVQSSLDVATVIQGNHNITYLRFGSGLEDDVTSIVASEYSGTSTTQQTLRGEDASFSHVHMVIKDVTVCTREGGTPGPAPREMRCETLIPAPRFGRGLTAAGAAAGGMAWENANLESEAQIPEMTNSWRHLYVRQPSAGAQLAVIAEKSGSHSIR